MYETEELTRRATVLLVDMSRSMLLRGCFLAAKKVAVALDTLIRTQFPRDQLHVVGFAYYAREIRPGALAELSWHGYEYGTNLQHGLMLARRLLAREHAANSEIVVITDGEPTAHFEDGQVEFSYPPTRRTISETLREVARCTREGITINTFMLERSRSLAEFVDRMTQLNRGRAFYATPEHLGEYVLVDYVGRGPGSVLAYSACRSVRPAWARARSTRPRLPALDRTPPGSSPMLSPPRAPSRSRLKSGARSLAAGCARPSRRRRILLDGRRRGPLEALAAPSGVTRRRGGALAMPLLGTWNS